MIIVTLKGADVFLSGEVERALFPTLAKVYNVDENELILHAQDGYLYHDGMDQTSFNLLVEIVAPEDYVDSEEMVASILMESSKNYSVHVRILFSYYDSTHYYERVNKDYPEYITEMQKVEVDESEYD